MKEQFTKLIDVKSIITITLLIVFCYLSIIKEIAGDQFLMIFTTIIAFYFGTQTEKTKQTIENLREKEED